MKKHIGILNGPNLNLLGTREPEVYGDQTFDDYLQGLKSGFPSVGIEYLQSNHEGALIDCLHDWGFRLDGIVLNAGGYTHTSVALADAVRSIPCPVIELHISNTFQREEYRHRSFLSEACSGLIVGFGLEGYRMAVEQLLRN